MQTAVVGTHTSHVLEQLDFSKHKHFNLTNHSLSHIWRGFLDCRGPTLKSVAGPVKEAVYTWEP